MSILGLFHLQMKCISRGGGKRGLLAEGGRQTPSHTSVVAKIAYRAGEKLKDEQTGDIHDYMRRFGVADKFILGPERAPKSFWERLKLWNYVQKREKRKDATLAREIIIGLPHQLNRAQRRELTRQFAQWLVDTYGVMADVAIHLPSWRIGHDQRNHHAHIVFTTRKVTEDGLGDKILELDMFKGGRQQTRLIRQTWQELVNAAYRMAGLDIRVDCRTLFAQGIDRIPTRHKGPRAVAMFDRGYEAISKVRMDGQGRVIDWPAIDQGKPRPEFVADIVNINEYREKFGPAALITQIMINGHALEVLFETLTDLESFIPRNLLPDWLKRKVERAWWKAVELIMLQSLFKEEAEKRREREGAHAQIRRVKEEIRKLEEQKSRLEALQRFYMRVEHQIITRPFIAPAAVRPATRELTNYQYQVELSWKAEKARAAVPPEYRPRIECPRSAAAGQGVLASALPADNGGLATPPALKGNFNAQANPVPEPEYRQKVKIGFGVS